MPATQARLEATRLASDIVGARRRDRFYLLLCLAMTCTVFVGFSFTYFTPIARGTYAPVPPIVHVHGWSFFAWYLLLPLQAGLVRTRRVATHRTLGMASIALAAVMILAGVIVSVVRIDETRQADGDPFWQIMALPIFAVWVLFTVFYIAAVQRRRRIDEHKRLMILASAVALAAATFRIVVQVVAFSPWTAAVGILVCTTFPVAGMLHDVRRRGSVHPVYGWGVTATLLVVIGTFLLGDTAAGDVLEGGLGAVGEAVRPLYYAGRDALGAVR
ncbi:MAG TPA: hypothetical protein VHG09_10695 [Longimicrobiales bacterium]|nr:hypothetical protein [Longimicrobiales bacterium]